MMMLSHKQHLLVDASNALRRLALINISITCQVFSQILINTYCNDAKSFVGGETILPLWLWPCIYVCFGISPYMIAGFGNIL